MPAEGATPQPALAPLSLFGFPRASALGGVGATGVVLSGEDRNPEWVRDEGFPGEVWGGWAWKAVSQRALSWVERSREVPGSVLRSQEPEPVHGAVTMVQCPVGDPGFSDKDSVSGALHTSSRFLQAPVECYSLFCSREVPRMGVEVLKCNCAAGILQNAEVQTA